MTDYLNTNALLSNALLYLSLVLPAFGLFLLLAVAKVHGFRWGLASLVAMVGSYLTVGPLPSVGVGIFALASCLHMRGWWLFLVSFACVLILHVAASFRPGMLGWLLVIACIGFLLLWGWLTARNNPPTSLDGDFDERQRRRQLARNQATASKTAFEQALGLDES